MIDFSTRIYKFFSAHKAFFLVLLTILCACIFFFGSKLQYEEDISKILPSTSEGSSENLVFNDIKVKDKIFVLFEGNTDSCTVDDLMLASQTFANDMITGDSSNNYIDNILYRLDDEMFPSLIDFLFSNIPSFIDSTNFETMVQLCQSESIDKQMEENFALLSSEAGMAFFEILRNDPIGFRNTFMNKINEIKDGLGGNYAMIDGYFFTPDSTVAVAFLSPNFKAFDSKNGTYLVDEMEKTIHNLNQKYPHVDIIFHGAPIQSVFNSRQIKSDLMMTMSVSLLLIVVLIVICYRRPLSTLISLILPVLFGAFFGLAIMYFIKGKMSLLAVGIGALILAVGLSYCIHVLTHYKYTGSAMQVIKDQTVPIFLSCITTIGAFLGLLFTTSELLKDFGIFASFVLVGCAVFCIFFLPPLFTKKGTKYSKKAFKTLQKINGYPLHEHWWISFCILFIFGICLVASRNVQFDSDLRNIGYYDPMVMRSQNTLAEKTTPGCVTKYYATPAQTLDSAVIFYRSNVKKLQDLKDEGLIHSFGQSGNLLVSEQEQTLRIKRWQDFWTEEKIDEVRNNIESAGANYGFSSEFFQPFFDMLTASYQPVDMLESEMLPQAILSNVVEKTRDTYMIFTPVQSKPEVVFNVGDRLVRDNPHFMVIDPMYYTSDMVRIITDDFNTIVSISSIFVLIILLIHFRSLLLALLAFIPMGISWYTVLGIMAVFGIKFNLINIVVSTFVFGVGVDYSIFIMDGLLSENYNKDNKLILFHKTAIFFSAIALIICSVALIFAKHTAIASVGVVTLIGMVSTILTTYTLQPLIFKTLAQLKITGKIIARCSKRLQNR